MPRSIEEWRGKDDNAPIPQRVKLRVFEREGRLCRICGLPIEVGDGVDFHHDPPLADGGEHRESRIFPVHRRCHRMQTAREALARAESRATVAHHYGISRPRHVMPGSKASPWKRKINGQVERRGT